MHSSSWEIMASFSRNSRHPFFVFLHLNRVVSNSNNFLVIGLCSVEINRPHGHLFRSLASPVLQSWQIWCCDKHWYHSDFPALGPHSHMKHFNSSFNTWFVSFDAIFELLKIRRIQNLTRFFNKINWAEKTEVARNVNKEKESRNLQNNFSFARPRSAENWVSCSVQVKRKNFKKKTVEESKKQWLQTTVLNKLTFFNSRPIGYSGQA